MALSQIIGHDKTIERLKSLLISGRVPPALLFTGPEGVGKFLAAREFARALACLHTPPQKPAAEESLFSLPSDSATNHSPLITDHSVDACGVCASCLQVDSGAHPDVRIIDTVFQAALLDEEESRNLKVDTIREVCRYAGQTPILSARKAFIIRDAEMMVIQAQNALLKTLEEPPPGTTLILTASRKNALLATIRSRCHILEFPPLPRTALEKLLEAQGRTLAEAAALSSLAQGSLKKAEDLLKLSARFKGAAPQTGMGAFKMAAALPKDSHRARNEVSTLLDLLLAGARARWAAAPADAVWRAAPAGEKELSSLVARLLTLRRMTDQNVSYSLILETALLESEKRGIRPENIIR